MEQKRVSLMYALLICLLASLFYFYEFFVQVLPGVLTNELMNDLHIGSVGVGVVSATYYFAYTPMQIPAGILYDRFSAKRIILIMMLICTLSVGLLAFAHDPYSAALSRFLAGFSSAFAFIGALVIVSRECSTQHFALLSGCTQTLGCLAAMLGEAPLVKLSETLGWRHGLLLITGVGFLFIALVYFLVKDDKANVSTKKREPNQEHHMLRNFLFVLRGQQTRWIALFSFCIWAPILIFAALWGVNYLHEAYNISMTQASLACSMVWLGIGIGSPFMGRLSDQLKRRTILLAVCASLGAIASVLVIYCTFIPHFLLYILLFIFGWAASGQSLSFAVIRDISRPSVVGTAIGFNNMAVVAGGLLFQPFVGLMLRWGWHGQTLGKLPYYPAQDYRYALAVVPLCYIIAALVSFFKIEETHCELRYLKMTAHHINEHH